VIAGAGMTADAAGADLADVLSNFALGMELAAADKTETDTRKKATAEHRHTSITTILHSKRRKFFLLCCL
jgi:erythromycin esterase-like protein